MDFDCSFGSFNVSVEKDVIREFNDKNSLEEFNDSALKRKSKGLDLKLYKVSVLIVNKNKCRHSTFSKRKRATIKKSIECLSGLNLEVQVAKAIIKFELNNRENGVDSDREDMGYLEGGLRNRREEEKGWTPVIQNISEVAEVLF